MLSPVPHHELISGPSVATMTQAPATPWRNEEEEEEYAADPKAFMLSRCELWMDNAEFFHNVVITATYYLPAFQILPGGTKIHLPQITQAEAISQGKVGLVVAKGPLAFVDCPELGVFFKGQNLNIGDWAQYDIRDNRQFTINRIHCRILKDVSVIARLKDPRLVY